MQQVFDPAQFLDITVESPFEERIPLPIGEYTAMIGQISARSWQSKDGTKAGVAWDIPLVVDVPPDVQQTWPKPCAEGLSRSHRHQQKRR